MIHQFLFASFLATSLLLSFVWAAIDEGLDVVQFSYTGSTAPEHWGNLSPTYAACSSGKNQSPVNIIRKHVVLNKSLTALKEDYSSENATLMSSGVVVGVHYGGNLGDLTINGKKYNFKQMHWHSPAEHQIDGQKFDAELHLVHEADDGSYAVVAMLYQIGKPDPLINKLKQPLKKLGQEKCTGEHQVRYVNIGVLDGKKMITRSRKYYRYMGSLTTPPCSENVIWNVLARVRTISNEQVKDLRAPLCQDCKDNHRQLQQLNSRRIEFYSDQKVQRTNKST